MPALVFNDDVMLSVNSIKPDRIVAENGEITMFIVAKNSVTGGSYFHGFLFYRPSGANRIGFDFSNPSLFFNYGICCATSSRISINSAPYQTRWAIYTGVRKGDAAQIRVNGVGSAPTTATISPLPGNLSGQLTIGSGTNGTTVNRLVGGVAEIIVFNRGLGISEVESIEAYLSQKWKIKL